MPSVVVVFWGLFCVCVCVGGVLVMIWKPMEEAWNNLCKEAMNLV